MSDNLRVSGYKVLNTSTGLYLTGGASLRESKVGKIWHNTASAINSINLKLKASKSLSGADRSSGHAILCAKNNSGNYRESVLNFEIVELKESGRHNISFYLDKLAL
jgi:hypothetical protein